MGNRIPGILYRRGPLYANSRRLHEDTEKQHEEEVKTETIPSEPETQANTRAANDAKFNAEKNAGSRFCFSFISRDIIIIAVILVIILFILRD
ncbi:MAG TPA: hypothetical protein GXX49_08405 [Clostridiaceae bacterium]|jgi:hypothetical protein|nr:hypothetical protein [Clostridiaceae bacterium]